MADVEVKRALTSGVAFPDREAMGMDNNNVPIMMMTRNPKTKTCGPESFLSKFIIHPLFRLFYAGFLKKNKSSFRRNPLSVSETFVGG